MIHRNLPQQHELESLPLDPKKYWYSFDLGCCAALLCAHYQLAGLDRNTPGKTQFIVYRDDGLDEAVENYWAGQLSVDARQYFDTLRMLKNRLHSSD